MDLLIFLQKVWYNEGVRWRKHGGTGFSVEIVLIKLQTRLPIIKQFTPLFYNVQTEHTVPQLRYAHLVLWGSFLKMKPMIYEVFHLLRVRTVNVTDKI